jgi:hypothetical protein
MHAIHVSIVETLGLWKEIQPRDFMDTMRRQQLGDILSWCADNAGDKIQDLCDSMREAVITGQERRGLWSSPMTSRIDISHRDVLSIKPWDLAQYFGVYDYMYVSRVLSDSSLEDIVARSTNDDTVSTNPDLRADQVWRITISLIQDPILGHHQCSQ